MKHFVSASRSCLGGRGTKECAFHLFYTTQEVSPNKDVVMSKKNKNALNTDNVVRTPEKKLYILPIFYSPLYKWRPFGDLL